jgi:NAD(P)-dependent dehydrogenase (short-subunit alcohol dehydrogenase family)
MKEKKVAAVTGSSTGIGFETSIILAKNDFYTYATMRNTDKSQEIVDIANRERLQTKVYNSMLMMINLLKMQLREYCQKRKELIF